MLNKARAKLGETNWEDRVAFHRCGLTDLKLKDRDYLDFVLAFYMIHEVRDQDRLYAQIRDLLKPRGRILVVEPAFHVSNQAFHRCLDAARNAGLIVWDGPRMRFQKTAVLSKYSFKPNLVLGRMTFNSVRNLGGC